MCFASCEKDKGEEWTDDSPIIQFKDPKFLEDLITQGIYNHQTGEFKPSIDKNADGQISEKEASVVTHLSVSNDIRNIDEIRYFTSLETLNCSYNQLTTLDLSENKSLTSLDCSRNQLTSLDVGNNTAMTSLDCYDNQLASLDVSNNTALTELLCDNNQLTSLDLSNNTALTYLSCDNNQLTSLDVSNNTALTNLWCYNNQLITLDLSKNTALTYLVCYSNNITSLDVSMCRGLENFRCVEYYMSEDGVNLRYDTKLPLESLKIYVYHILNDDDISAIEQAYGEILEYVE